MQVLGGCVGILKGIAMLVRGMKAEDGYKAQTMCTLLMGIASIVFIWIISLFCH